jgi:tetratricopeptide (TPR) repeat protein
MFVFLAMVFAFGFVLFGVGSGSTGIGNLLQDNLGFLNFSGSGDPNIGSLQKKTREHPRDAKAFRDLATALQAKSRDDEAIAALERYTALRPKDQDALAELAALYARRADDLTSEAQQVQLQAAGVTTSLFSPTGTTPLGRAFADPNALGDPIDRAINSVVSEQTTDIYQRLSAVQTKAVGAYKRLVAADPRNAQLQIQLGLEAQQAGDAATALTAYRRFLKLAPQDPTAPQVRKIVKQLQAQSSPAAATG